MLPGILDVSECRSICGNHTYPSPACGLPYGRDGRVGWTNRFHFLQRYQYKWCLTDLPTGFLARRRLNFHPSSLYYMFQTSFPRWFLCRLSKLTRILALTSFVCPFVIQSFSATESHTIDLPCPTAGTFPQNSTITLNPDAETWAGGSTNS